MRKIVRNGKCYRRDCYTTITGTFLLMKYFKIAIQCLPILDMKIISHFIISLFLFVVTYFEDLKYRSCRYNYYIGLVLRDPCSSFRPSDTQFLCSGLSLQTLIIINIVILLLCPVASSSHLQCSIGIIIIRDRFFIGLLLLL